MIISSIVNGGWSEWTSWSTCGQNCQKSRSRLCNNPTPANGGSECSGENTEDMSCSGGNCVPDPVIITSSQTVDVSSWNVTDLKYLIIGGGGGGRVILKRITTYKCIDIHFLLHHCTKMNRYDLTLNNYSYH